MSKQQKKRSKSNAAVSKGARRASAKQAAKKTLKARQRITKEQAADATARINDEYAKVHTMGQKSAETVQVHACFRPVAEGTVQELTDVMQTL